MSGAIERCLPIKPDIIKYQVSKTCKKNDINYEYYTMLVTVTSTNAFTFALIKALSLCSVMIPKKNKKNNNATKYPVSRFRLYATPLKMVFL